MSLRDNLTLYSLPPPGSGAVLGFIMRVMGYYEDHNPSSSETLHNSTLFHHRLMETYKYAFAKRAKFGDPQFDDVTQALEDLMSETFASSVKSKIDDDRTYEPTHYDREELYIAESHGTSHLSVLDRFGNAVAATSTVNGYFGSSILSERTGLVLNNEIDGFAFPNFPNQYGLKPSGFNQIEHGKRPQSSMCPSVIVDPDGNVRLVIGAAGGPKITTNTASVAIRHLWMGESIKVANDAPRLHHQLYPNEITYEDTFPSSILEELSQRNHTLKQLEGRGAVVNVVSKENDGFVYANSDYRKIAIGEIDGF